MKRFRIDFTVRELDLWEGEEPRGVSFSDDVNSAPPPARPMDPSAHFPSSIMARRLT